MLYLELRGDETWASSYNLRGDNRPALVSGCSIQRLVVGAHEGTNVTISLVCSKKRTKNVLEDASKRKRDPSIRMDKTLTNFYSENRRRRSLRRKGNEFSFTFIKITYSDSTRFPRNLFSSFSFLPPRSYEFAGGLWVPRTTRFRGNEVGRPTRDFR